VTATLAEVDAAAATGEPVACMVLVDGGRCDATADFRVGTRCAVLLAPCLIPVLACLKHVDDVAVVLESHCVCRTHEAHLRVVDVRPIGA